MTNNKGFTLKDIAGAVVEKVKDIDIVDERINPELAWHRGYNSAIDKFSSVRLRMNREKLASEILTVLRKHKIHTYDLTKELADAIIANQLDIIEVCNDQ